MGLQKFQIFEGLDYVATMRKVHKNEMHALSAISLFNWRLSVLRTSDIQLIARAWNHHYDTSTGLANKGNEYRVLQSAELLQNIGQSLELLHGRMPLTNLQWNNLTSESGFTWDEVQAAGLGEWLTKDSVLKHKFWTAVAGKVLQPYAEATFGIGHFIKGMAVYVREPQSQPTLRPIVILDGSVRRSYADAHRNLYGARLIGIPNNVSLDMVIADGN